MQVLHFFFKCRKFFCRSENTQLQADEEENTEWPTVDSTIYGIQKCGCFGQLKQEQCGIEARDRAEKKNTHAKRYNNSLLSLKCVTKNIGLTFGNVHFTMTVCVFVRPDIRQLHSFITSMILSVKTAVFLEEVTLGCACLYRKLHHL